MMRVAKLTLVTSVLFLLGAAIGCDGSEPGDDAGAMTDAGTPDAGPVEPLSLDHCAFEDVPPTAGAGGTVSAGALSAGVAEAALDIPLGASLAAYTDRTGSSVDGRRVPELAGTFAPAMGVETIPRIRALALSAGDETVIFLKVDMASAYQAMLFDVEARLGAEYAGKVVFSTSHTHSSFGNYSGHIALEVGFGRIRGVVYEAFVSQMTAVAQAALDARAPARLGIAYDGDFDPENRVNRDRRSENDHLMGGPAKDNHLFVLRVDTDAGEPLAVLPVFGIHGTNHGGSNLLAATDSIGGIERVLEEHFERAPESDLPPVLVMHLQGAAGDVSPAGQGSIDCMGTTLCSDFARPETVGHFARDAIVAAWEAAGEDMRDELEMEMVTRTVPLGPDWETFRIREGALEYAPFDPNREADGIVFDDDGEIVSPIDEFNAPAGAALCNPGGPAIARLAQMPGTRELRDVPYRGCNRLEGVTHIFEALIDTDFGTLPLCETARTTVSALRIGDWMFGTMPGELMTELAVRIRDQHSPMPPERTILLGYAQDHGGYLLSPEDWLSGGYEPTITFWGPLEGEYVAEQMAALMALVTTPEREDAAAGGLPRPASPSIDDGITLDTSPTTPGTVPEALPESLVTRSFRRPPSPQPAAEVIRLESAYFTWVGDDPMRGTPRVFIEREVEGEWELLRRRSGRAVQDGDIILTWTADPIERDGSPRTHYFTAEWQTAAPLGMPGLEAVGDRVGLPAGRYRFYVDAPTYEVTSAPFEVRPTALATEEVTRDGDLSVRLGYVAPGGYRLLDLSTSSSGFVPARSREITAQVSGEAEPRTLSTDGSGQVVVTGAGALEVTLTDPFGNTVTLTP